jgi:hypothetical protein
VQVGEERAAVEVPPGAFLAVVVDRQLEVTLRAGEPRSSWMLGPHVDPLVVDGHLDPAHLPRWEESQQVPVELGVTHHTIVADHPRTDPANTSSQKLPTQNPEAPKKEGRHDEDHEAAADWIADRLPPSTFQEEQAS